MSTLNLMPSAFENEPDGNSANSNLRKTENDFRVFGKKMFVGQKLTVRIEAIDEELKLKRHHKTAVSGLLRKIDSQKMQIKNLSEKVARLSAIVNIDDEAELDESEDYIRETFSSEDTLKKPVIKIKRKFSLSSTAEVSPPNVQAQLPEGKGENSHINSNKEEYV